MVKARERTFLKDDLWKERLQLISVRHGSGWVHECVFILAFAYIDTLVALQWGSAGTALEEYCGH